MEPTNDAPDGIKREAPFGPHELPERTNVIDFGEPSAEQPPKSAPRRPTRQQTAPSPKARVFTRENLREAFSALNVALFFTGQRQYILDDEEADLLTDSWWDVLEQYPDVNKYLVEGKKFTVCGRAIFTTYIVVSKRINVAKPLADSAATGPAHNTNGHDGQREDYTVEEATFE